MANKRAIINVKNNDNQCFLWCVLRALNPVDNHPERVDMELRVKKNTLTMKGIEYPVSLKDLNKFEKQNPSISITVLGYEEKGVYPLKISDCVDREHNIILMLFKNEGVNHYCLVKNLSRLLTPQVSNRNGKHYFCLRCSNYEAVKIELTPKGTTLKYTTQNLLRITFF